MGPGPGWLPLGRIRRAPRRKTMVPINGGTPMRAKSVMDGAIPEFGLRVSGVAYRDRPGAYAVILGSENRFAFVRGRAGRLFLPGGGMRPDEWPADALMREITEEIGWSVRILGTIGRATQLVFAEGEGHLAIRATYFRAALIERQTTQREHELIWLSAVDAAVCLARESDEWAISQVCKSCERCRALVDKNHTDDTLGIPRFPRVLRQSEGSERQICTTRRRLYSKGGPPDTGEPPSLETEETSTAVCAAARQGCTHTMGNRRCLLITDLTLARPIDLSDGGVNVWIEQNSVREMDVLHLIGMVECWPIKANSQN